MKTELSSLEISVIADELKSIIGARIQKVYQDDKVIHLSLHVPGQGTKTLIIGDGKIFLTKYRLSHSETPSPFAMYLRKHCGGQKIRNVFQHDFERIMIIEIDDYRLIAELFSKGNVIFTDKENRIWSLLERQEWRSRSVKLREEYKFPPQGINPVILTIDVLSKSLGNSDKQIVAFLAREMSLGGTFAEEVCSTAKIDKKKQCRSISKPELESLLSSLKDLFMRQKKPQIVLEKGAECDVLPFDVEKYNDLGVFEKRHYESFIDACDDFFVKKMAESRETKQAKDVTEKKSKLDRRLENQRSAIDALKKQETDATKKAELIYGHYQSFEKLMDAIEKHGLADAKSLAKQVVSIDLKTKTFTVNVGGMMVEISTLLNSNENANLYYGKAKKSRDKIKKASIALVETEKKIKEAKVMENETAKVKVIIEKKQEAEKWFHKFRWFLSAGGFLVVGGKDATSNEVLIKRHVEAHDIIFHTDITGSPFVVLKTEGKTVDKKTIEEAAQFTGIYSRAWKAKVGVAEVYHVAPDQVSKKAPSGEYISKGSFMVYGKKNIMKTELKLGIGFRDGAILSGPMLSVASQTGKYVVVVPGDESAPDLSRKIKAALFSKCSKDEQEILRKTGADEISKAIPFGAGQMA